VIKAGFQFMDKAQTEEAVLYLVRDNPHAHVHACAQKYQEKGS